MNARLLGIVGGWSVIVGLACNVDATGQGTGSTASSEASTGSSGATGDPSSSTGSSPDSSGNPDPNTSSTTEPGTTALPGTDESSGTAGVEAEWLEGYEGRKAIQIHPTVDLVDFPVALAFSDMDVADAAQSDGSDLTITAADGVSVLPFELELYEDPTGTLVMWVDAGPLSGTQTTVVYLYFGHDDPPAPPDPETAWPSRYEGVWHMNVDGLQLRDSTASSNTGVAGNGGNSAAEEQGIFGLGSDFDGNDSHVVGDPGDGTLDFGMDSFGLSVWLNIEESQGMNDIPVHKGCTTAFDPGYGFFLGTVGWYGAIADGVILEGVYFGEDTELNGDWHHLALSIDRVAGVIVSYLDGMMVDSIPLMAANVDGFTPWAFSPSGVEINGRLDEIRIERGVVDADRVLAHVVNATDPDALFTVGATEAPPSE